MNLDSVSVVVVGDGALTVDAVDGGEVVSHWIGDGNSDVVQWIRSVCKTMWTLSTHTAMDADTEAEICVLLVARRLRLTPVFLASLRNGA